MSVCSLKGLPTYKRGSHISRPHAHRSKRRLLPSIPNINILQDSLLQTLLLAVGFLGKYLQICLPLWNIGGSLDLSVETWDDEIFRHK
jgi:hypothetical protein